LGRHQQTELAARYGGAGGGGVKGHGSLVRSTGCGQDGTRVGWGSVKMRDEQEGGGGGLTQPWVNLSYSYYTVQLSIAPGFPGFFSGDFSRHLYYF
jgi:hypothetical protein